uniref:Trace amine associated receptor 1 n=1 Tax=Petromyzon marinus TaxID=7757 RepID=S4R506_PETMA
MHNESFPSVLCVVTFATFNCTPSQMTNVERALLMGAFTIAVATTITGNMLTISSILYFRQLQTRTNVLALSLALADLLVGLLVMPFASTRTAYGCWFYGRTFCKVHTWFDYTLCTSSILNLARRVTGATLVAMLVLCWSGVVAYGLAYLLEWNIAGIEDSVQQTTCPDNCPVFMNVQFALTNTLCAYVTPMLLMLAAYANVYAMARAQARKISIAMLQARSADAAVRSRWSVAASEPLLGYASDPVVWEVANWFTYINSTMNPILFAAFNRSFRNAFYLIVSGKIMRGSYRGTDLFSFNGSGK